MAKNKVSKQPISKEEYTTNKVLAVFSICLFGVLVLMVLQRMLDYGQTWQAGLLLVKMLLGVGVAGVIWGIFLAVREAGGKKSAANRLICGRNVLIASMIMTASMGVIYYIGPAPIKLLYVVLPMLAVYYLIYHSYAPEFFLIAVDCGVGLGLIWVTYRALASASYGSMAYAAIGVMAVVTVIQLAVVASLRSKKGKVMRGGKTMDLNLSRNAYTMLTVTPLLMTLLVAVTLFAPTYLMITLGIGAAYLFITAVYYTVKLM